MRYIKKIKFDRKTNKTEIEYFTGKGLKTDEFSVRLSDEPRPEFKVAMAEMGKHWLDVLELSDLSITPNISSVSFSWGEGTDGHPVMGVTMYGQVNLKKATGVWGCNTPHRISEFYAESGDEGQLMSDELRTACLALISEAEAYIDGQRAQQSLFSVNNDEIKYPVAA